MPSLSIIAFVLLCLKSAFQVGAYTFGRLRFHLQPRFEKSLGHNWTQHSA
jgi:hypothetical protein